MNREEQAKLAPLSSIYNSLLFIFYYINFYFFISQILKIRKSHCHYALRNIIKLYYKIDNKLNIYKHLLAL